jgi:PAS domain-containing protein
MVLLLAALSAVALLADSDLAYVFLPIEVLLAFQLGRRRAVVGLSELELARAEEQRFRSLFETAPDGRLIVDHEGKVALVNAETERLFGFARDELIGASVDTLVPTATGWRAPTRTRPLPDAGLRRLAPSSTSTDGARTAPSFRSRSRCASSGPRRARYCRLRSGT